MSYSRIHKKFPWLRFDDLDLTFTCAKCNTTERVSEASMLSGDAESEADQFVNVHKDCEPKENDGQYHERNAAGQAERIS